MVTPKIDSDKDIDLYRDAVVDIIENDTKILVLTGATILEPRGGGLRWEEKEKKKVKQEICCFVYF